jgi:hypothetical protein
MVGRKVTISLQLFKSKTVDSVQDFSHGSRENVLGL